MHNKLHVHCSYYYYHDTSFFTLQELKYDLHFWIGQHSTQDEYGTAAYKTVELDTLVSHNPPFTMYMCTSLLFHEFIFYSLMTSLSSIVK